MLCAERGHEVRLWARDTDLALAMQQHRRNPRYLQDVPLPDPLQVTADLAQALRDRELVIVTVPSQALRAVMRRCAPFLPPTCLVLSAIKGIERETGKTMDAVLRETLHARHHPRLTFLSGPSFAVEIARRKPTMVTIACREEVYAMAVQSHLSCSRFRCYSDADVTGVELGGALKNITAIATGVSDGLALGANARAATLTRGLAEITRLGVRLGADPLTFQGLSGLGDLVLTCTGDLSRNRRVGLALAEGQQLPSILAELGGVAEGVHTTYAACQLADRLGVDMPIAQGVRALLEGEVDPRDGVERLLGRRLRSEKD